MRRGESKGGKLREGERGGRGKEDEEWMQKRKGGLGKAWR